MQGTTTKKHILIVRKEFGLIIAIKLLLSRKSVALTLLMKGK
jgi:hypothetical protein